MKRSYNRSAARRGGGSAQNPAFWEVALDPRVCEELPEEQRLWYESQEEVAVRLRRLEELPRLLAEVRGIIGAVLTPRQREVVHKYFLEGKSEAEIGLELGISAPSVSQHLFGKRRDGRSVGGAIARIRKELGRREGKEKEAGSCAAFGSDSTPRLPSAHPPSGSAPRQGSAGSSVIRSR